MSYHACARPSARRGESLQIQQHALGKFGMHARVSHILLSLLGPVYFGFLHSPYVVLVVWSAACAAIFFWSNGASLRHARHVAYTTYPLPLPYKLSLRFCAMSPVPLYVLSFIRRYISSLDARAETQPPKDDS